jgi:hypothetical protein
VALRTGKGKIHRPQCTRPDHPFSGT